MCINRVRITTLICMSILILVGMFLRTYNLETFQSLNSDEAVYSQTAFVMSRGYIPYRDVYIAHPPLFFYIECTWIILTGPSLFSLRFLNVLLGMTVTFVIYFICGKLYSSKLGFVAALLYTILPLSIFSNKLAIIDNSLALFSILMMASFLFYYNERKIKYLILAGSFAGISLLIKFTAIQVIVVPLVFMGIERRFRDLLLFTFLITIFPVTFMTVLFLEGLLKLFIHQAIYVQLFNRVFALTLVEKMYMFTYYLLWVLPLFILAVIAIKNSNRKEDEIIGVWYLAPLIFILLGTHTFLQYFIQLNAPLSILAAIAILKCKPSKDWFIHLIKPFNLSKILLVSMITALLLLPTLFSLSYSLGTSDEQEAKVRIANYVKKITTPDEKIWTTDASIAFLSRRIIIPVESEYYKYQGFFEGTFGYSTDETYRGPFSPGVPTLLSLQEILVALEKYKPKVIIINRDSFVDSLIWNGIYNSYYTEDGLSAYILRNYYLSKAFSPTNVEVWVRIS